MTLTAAERRAIQLFKQLEAEWPRSLWVFSADGRLNVMQCDERGQRVYMETEGVDPDHTVATIRIPSDGGDW